MEKASTTDRKLSQDFRVYFNKRKQWINVKLEDVSPRTFQKRGGGRWGYFIATWENPTIGKFGEIHFVKSRLRLDTVAHEIFHAITEHAWANKRNDRKYEEFYAKMTDELFRKIWKRI